MNKNPTKIKKRIIKEIDYEPTLTRVIEIVKNLNLSLDDVCITTKNIGMYDDQYVAALEYYQEETDEEYEHRINHQKKLELDRIVKEKEQYAKLKSKYG